MKRARIQYISAALILLSFAVYTVSPLYASIRDCADGASQTGRAGRQDVIYGILWVNVVLDELIDDEPDADRGATAQVASSKSDEDLILIKKKRTLFRERLTIKPILQCALLQFDRDDQRVLPQISYDIPRDLIHRHADWYHLLSTGLSPPQHLS
jgi:hypothetical protein